MIQNEPIYKTNRLTDLENKLMLSRAERMGGQDSYGVWDGHVHTAVFKMDSKVLLYSTENSAQCYVAA